MGKYVIHFDDKPWEDLDDELYYRCFEIPWFSTTKTTISRLTPYTEDSAYAHGYTEAESKYREIRDELEKQAYQRGYKEAYDTAYADAEEIYESGKRAMYQKGLKDAWEAARTLWNTPNRKEIFGHTAFLTALTTLTAQETIEKIRQYEQEKEMDGLRQNIQTIVDQCGYSLDEIAEVLAKMKES
jgi:transketolase